MQPYLTTVPAGVDEQRVGISYSGGGPLLLIELGIAQAFVDLKILPVAIAGVSAGAIAGTAHALDPIGGAGIKAAARALINVNDHKLAVTIFDIVGNVLGSLISARHLPAGLGDNAAVRGMAESAFKEVTGRPRLSVGDFGRDSRTKLYIGATDRNACERYWFPDSADAAMALVASSAIPGIFPPTKITIDGTNCLYIDGGVAQNQPISKLVEDDKCGTIYACAVGYDGEPIREPKDALDNALSSISIITHESSRLEQAYVEAKFAQAGKGKVHHIHPDGPFNIANFNFTESQIRAVMDLACQQTKTWIEDNNLMPSVESKPAVPVGAGSVAGPSGGGRA